METPPKNKGRIGGDPDFVFFLFDSSFPVRKNILTFPLPPREKAALYKRVKRRTQKHHPENWKHVWAEMKKALKAGQDPIFSLETRAGVIETFGPVSRIPGGYGFREMKGTGRPVDLLVVRQWGKIWNLITYFRKVSRKPHWTLISNLVNFYLGEERWDYSTLQRAWQDRQKDFAILNPEAFLENRLESYRRSSERTQSRLDPAE